MKILLIALSLMVASNAFARCLGNPNKCLTDLQAQIASACSIERVAQGCHTEIRFVGKGAIERFFCVCEKRIEDESPYCPPENPDCELIYLESCHRDCSAHEGCRLVCN